MTETQAIAKWRKMHPKDMIIKLHGGRYQSSLPDTIHIAGNGNGEVLFYEVKCVDGSTLPWSKCRLDQDLMLKKLARMGAPAYYLVWSKIMDCFYLVDPLQVKEGESYHLSGAFKHE